MAASPSDSDYVNQEFPPGAGLENLVYGIWDVHAAAPVVLMMASLALVLKGHVGVVPALATGEILTALGILSFAANLFINVKQV